MPEITDKHSGLPIRIWDEIELTVEKDDSDGHYISRVVDFIPGGIVLIEPIWKDSGGSPISGTIVNVEFVRSDALYRFQARIKPFYDEYVKRCLLYEISDITRLQRREYARVDYATSLKYKIVSKKEEVAGNKGWAESISTNLSAGGMLFKADEGMRENDLLLLQLDNFEVLHIPRIVAARCRRLLSSDNNVLAGVEFITRESRGIGAGANDRALPADIIGDFDLQAQNRLVRFVFNEQVKEHNRRLVK